mmetsp:Transcript_14999/g.41537  ORF Transcript_14999/g.41537 Transcript_14999/m.41537 type:complete len:216 (+) Transcript_14999:480-1127(+)
MMCQDAHQAQSSTQFQARFVVDERRLFLHHVIAQQLGCSPQRKSCAVERLSILLFLAMQCNVNHAIVAIAAVLLCVALASRTASTRIPWKVKLECLIRIWVREHCEHVVILIRVFLFFHSSSHVRDILCCRDLALILVLVVVVVACCAMPIRLGRCLLSGLLGLILIMKPGFFPRDIGRWVAHRRGGRSPACPTASRSCSPGWPMKRDTAGSSTG